MDSWTVGWIALTLLILRFLYWYLTKPYDYWKKRGVPSVSAVPIFGSTLPTLIRPQQFVLVERQKKYGRIHGYYEFSRPVLSVAEPDLIKDIMLKDFQIFPERRPRITGDPMVDKMVSSQKGEEWKRIRTIITPAFSSGRLKKMCSIMIESANIAAKNFERHAESGAAVDLKKIFGAFSLDVIARSAFGTTLDSHSDPENEFVRTARSAFSGNISFRVILFLLWPGLTKILPSFSSPRNVTGFFRDVALQIIKQRKETGQVKNDFLQLLLDANDEAEKENSTPADDQQKQQDDDGDKDVEELGHDHLNKQLFKRAKKYKGLTHDELIAQCILFFLAGYETTASTLSFASYLLALNPECQEKLIKEVDGVLERNNGELKYEDVQNMKYLENVIWETLRLYPPAVVNTRTASQDYKLEGTEITIPKGMVVQIPTYAIHRDPEFYDDPEEFQPESSEIRISNSKSSFGSERFNPEAKAKRNPYTYLPFGAGPRNCIGMRFALIEIKFCLSVLMSKFRFKRSPETKVPLEFYSSRLLMQPKEVMVVVERRKDKISTI